MKFYHSIMGPTAYILRDKLQPANPSKRIHGDEPLKISLLGVLGCVVVWSECDLSLSLSLSACTVDPVSQSRTQLLLIRAHTSKPKIALAQSKLIEREKCRRMESGRKVAMLIRRKETTVRKISKEGCVSLQDGDISILSFFYFLGIL